MSHQLYFIFTQAHKSEFVRYISGEGMGVLLKLTTEGSEVKMITSNLHFTGNNGNCIAFKPEMNQIVLEELGDTRSYIINQDRSPVIEYSIVGNRKGEFVASRLYYVSSYYDVHGKKVEKSPEFCNWSKGVFKWVRSRCAIIDSKFKLYASIELAQHIHEYKLDLRPGLPRLKTSR